ncbi:hypothetical protein TorRG33x02_042020 [Trema orientale]|uniref:Uncharacterized protein n=1 Tax=Trema orientale TaxID=63057 RepID=A0A2P5FQK0_TREOI|nr:hypothetical protein TorRG33x02_042020 [Trema orientale]
MTFLIHLSESKEQTQKIDAKGQCLLEMPIGMGKTIALLFLITSYTLSNPKTLSSSSPFTRWRTPSPISSSSTTTSSTTSDPKPKRIGTPSGLRHLGSSTPTYRS